MYIKLGNLDKIQKNSYFFREAFPKATIVNVKQQQTGKDFLFYEFIPDSKSKWSWIVILWQSGLIQFKRENF